MAHPLVELITGLIPPKDNDPVKLYNWQWRSVALGLICLGIGLYAAKLVPGIHPAYALQTEVDNSNSGFQRQIDELKKGRIEMTDQINRLVAANKENQKQSLTTNLIEATRYKCRATVPGNAAGDGSKSFWTRRWQDLKLTYRELTGESWSDVPCDSF